MMTNFILILYVIQCVLTLVVWNLTVKQINGLREMIDLMYGAHKNLSSFVLENFRPQEK